MAVINMVNQADKIMEISNDFRRQANELQQIMDETSLTYSGKDADIYRIALRNIITELYSIAYDAESISQHMLNSSNES